MRAWWCVVGLAACIETHVPEVEAKARRALCEYIADCAPVQTRGVDWGVVDECEAAVVDAEACIEAWGDVPCLPPDATLEDVMAATPYIARAMEACL